MNDYFTYGGLDSRDYGVWVFDLNTDTGAEYIQDEITVQGRHGKLLMPNGRLENLPHRYMGVVFEDAEARMTAFRDALMRYTGYQVLTDSLHPNEFYQARYLGGIDPTVARGRTMVKFVIEFNRMPQRFLLEGKRTITYPPGIEDSKNLLPYPYHQTTMTINGITFTDNGDGSITVNGTATTNAVYLISNGRTSSANGFTLAQGAYKLFGCPSGGSNTTYQLQIASTVETPNIWVTDNGDGADVTIDADRLWNYNRIIIYNGVTVNNLTFWPMVRLESEKNIWMPYYHGANTIYNPTNQTSAPIIRVYGYGELGLNGETITIASHNKSYLDIDSDMMDCYYGLENMNGYVTFSGLDFPVLKAGVNTVSLGENISRIEVKPRWWRV